MKSLNNSRSYVLLTLGFLFTLGAAVRFLPSNLAIAESPLKPAHPAETGDHAPATAPIASGTKQIDQVCFTAETAALLADDQKKLKQQQAALQELELELLARQQELDRRAADLQAVEATLQDRWGQLQDASNDDMDHLARMYGTMKPDQAASIFNQMDSDFAAGFLRLMRSEQAGMILAGMETKKAYAVSLRLAAMNEDVRNSSSTE
ncbi:MotE family protein [Hyphomonas sp.]|uniref:MotE family protein n=1 Tax=Hyphomonas sp. TaxID=87 RepID=UPI0035289534